MHWMQRAVPCGDASMSSTLYRQPAKQGWVQDFRQAVRMQSRDYRKWHRTGLVAAIEFGDLDT